jgi:lysyl-tRNA synthetase class 2
MIQSLRNFLHSQDFVEVETPTLSASAGGAIAKPFVTHSTATNQRHPLFLRIAPELYLKVGHG